MWEFPGGKLEADETLQHCIVREIQEELDVGSIAGDILAESVFTYPGGTIRLITVELTLNSTHFVLQVHDRVEWCTPRELLSYELAPADIPIAMEIIRKYG
ncbi:NUDIX domain-containing protein [Pseudomonas aeruginosa]|nr:NUDIX domain-containing protein [Pseudomonas aeruginosa]